MRYGCAWYPEQWPRERWDADLALMRDAGMNVVRVGEFAWSRMEPADGRFELDWLDEAIARAAAHGLATVLGTPTAAPPAWLTFRHPDVLRTQPNGQVLAHGIRQHVNPAHPAYLEFCRRIADALAARFGDRADVIGWQIDNEFGDISYDPLTRRQFQDYCRERFGTLDELNRRWTTAYWSQEYTAWDQIPLAFASQNACLQAALRGFVTRIWLRFFATQADAIRARLRRPQFVTQNFSYNFAMQDPHDLARGMDVAGVDPYVFTGHLDSARMGFYLAATRGLKRAPFWVMETQPGFVNYMPVNTALDPGETRRMVWHQVGHGAEGVMFWQWRGSYGGQEQLHGTVLAPDGRPRPVYRELAQAGRELAQAAEALAGTANRPRVALAWSYRDRAAIEICRFHRDYDAWKLWCAVYAALRRLGLDVDAVRADQGLDGYDLVWAPQMAMLDEPLARRCLDYAAGGGCLLLGPRAGLFDGDGALLPARPPGPRLAAALGAHVEEYYSLDAPVPVAGDAATGAASTWAEWIEPDAGDVEVALRYGRGHAWLDGRAALASRRVGRGRIGYLGAWLDPAAMVGVAEWACRAAGVPMPWGRLPDGVEVSCRVGEGRRLHVICNHAAEPRELPAPFRGVCLLTGESVSDRLVIPANEVRVLRE
jgi:beta-galactosidase